LRRAALPCSPARATRHEPASPPTALQPPVAPQVPYLEDPNQGVYLFESSAIVKYLYDTYAKKG
jgi:glutathione S-transferase